LDTFALYEQVFHNEYCESEEELAMPIHPYLNFSGNCRNAASRDVLEQSVHDMLEDQFGVQWQFDHEA